MAPLKPVDPPIAVFNEYVSQEPQTIVLREKVLSVTQDSFDIKTINGDKFLSVHGAWVSFSGRKKVTDAHGKHIFDIVKEHFHLHDTYAVENTHRKKVLEVKSNMSRMSLFFIFYLSVIYIYISLIPNSN